MAAVFVYGTLRPGSWNHDRWLAPWLTAPCRPARLEGHVLHHLDGLPYIVPGGGRVVGDLADVPDDALAHLDVLEDVAGGHYVRVEVPLGWTYVAGPRVAERLGPSTLVDHGDWLALVP